MSGEERRQDCGQRDVLRQSGIVSMAMVKSAAFMPAGPDIAALCAPGELVLVPNATQLFA